MSIICGMNGFGRFGLHLLSNYLELIDSAQFEIKYINDDFLSIHEAFHILTTDKYVRLYEKYDIAIENDYLVFNGKIKIQYTNQSAENIPWLGIPDVFLECSGKYTDANKAREFKTGNTEFVLISATSMNADQMLVYGFNHTNLQRSSDVISYGSCTVNAFTPLVEILHGFLDITSADVNVIHNLPEHHLEDESKNTLNRCSCTLSKVAPQLLDCISDDNFHVNYTLIPYSGVSIFDYSFGFNNKKSVDEIIEYLTVEMSNGSLENLYSINENDTGPECHLNTRFSAVLIKENINVKNDKLYIHSYFDNENSANRFFDLTNYVSSVMIADEEPERKVSSVL